MADDALLRSRTPLTARARFLPHAAVLVAVAVGVLFRAAGYRDVFLHGGVVRLGVADSMFFARRALYSFSQFPHVLQFDWYLNYPHGAAAPCPPLFGWLIAAVARALGHDVHTLETVAAWSTAVPAALLPIPAFLIGRSIKGSWLGIAAAWLVMVLPSGMLVTRLGRCDHDGVVALIAAFWLFSSLREIGRSGRPLIRHAFLHGLIVASMLLMWSGSLLYLALAEGARLASIVILDGRPRRYAAVALSLAVAAVPILGWLLVSEPPLGGPFTSQTLSWLHLIALLSIAALAAGLAEIERRHPAEAPGIRVVRGLLLAACLGLPLLLVPAVRHALFLGIGFLGKQDVWAAGNLEQVPLFTSISASLVPHATTRFGFFAYLVPLAPLIVGLHAWRARGDQRQRLFVLFWWVLALSGLVLSQVRYGTDFTVPGAVAFVLALEAIRSLLLRRLSPQAATGAVVALGVLLMGPAWQWDALQLGRAGADRAPAVRSASHGILSANDSVIHFAREVRNVTPQTSGFLDSAERPEYGLLVPPMLGHLFTYVARRPVPANNLGPYLDLQTFLDARRFYLTSSENEAVGLLEKLRVRYVVAFGQWPAGGTFNSALYWTNGSAGERLSRPTGRLRLIAEGPRRGRPMLEAAPRGWPRNRLPYKLFELVKGAVLVARCEPETIVQAAIVLDTPEGTRRYLAAAPTDSSGRARLRVPYSSADPAPVRSSRVRSAGDWLVQCKGHEARVDVTDTDVRQGHEVVVRWSGTPPRGE